MVTNMPGLSVQSDFFDAFGASWTSSPTPCPRECPKHLPKPSLRMRSRATLSSAFPVTPGFTAAIAARFQLDGDPRAGKPKVAGVGKTSTLIALLAALIALGLVGFAAWLMYSDWTVAATA